MSLKKGELIIRKDLQYPEGALVVEGFDEDGNLLAYPLGGGPQLRIPPSDLPRFDRVTKDERESIYRKSEFYLEGVNSEYVGWTDGTLWNGWATPRFEYDVAEQIARQMNGRYDAESDAFITKLNAEEEDVWKSELIELPDGGQIKVYPVGASSWIWDEVDDQ